MRLFEEIKASGYVGCYTQVKEYVRKVRPRVPEEPAVRFETPDQGQVDFADFRDHVRVPGCACASCGCLHSTDVHVGGPRLWWCASITKDERAAGGRVTENAEFLRFADQGRTTGELRPTTAGPSRRTLNRQARHWLDHMANVRTHGTLKERPADRSSIETCCGPWPVNTAARGDTAGQGCASSHRRGASVVGSG